VTEAGFHPMRQLRPRFFWPLCCSGEIDFIQAESLAGCQTKVEEADAFPKS